jgi:hypothetical protein
MNPVRDRKNGMILSGLGCGGNDTQDLKKLMCFLKTTIHLIIQSINIIEGLPCARILLGPVID